jgi:polyhydroxyalkanoate synthase
MGSGTWGTHRPQLGATPKDVVWRRDKAQLWRYRGGPVRFEQPLVIVTSLVSRSYILDLLPGRSSVEFLRNAGFEVFMIDWGIPDELDAANTFETYVDEYLPRAIDAVIRETGAREITMVGYCLGGVMAFLHANGHESPVRNLVLLATPLDFSEMGPMVAALVEGRLDPEELLDETGNVPADVLYSGFCMMAPTTVVAQNAALLENLWNDEF